jgi:hypothetical protein
VAGKWVLVAICWGSLWTTGRPGRGQPQVTDPGERVSPRLWLRQYLGVEFPSSARDFVLYYRSTDEDVVLFSFDITEDDLPDLMNGKSIFPRYGDLARGGPGLSEQIATDAGSRYFAQKVAAMRNALSSTRRRTSPAEPLEVRVWVSETPAETWAVCVAVVADKHIERAHVSGGFPIPAAHQDVHSYVVIDGRPGQPYDTSIWQRWNLDEAGHREFLQMVEARSDIGEYSSAAAVRLVDRLDTRGPTPKVPWWKPAELRRSQAGYSEPPEGFWDRSSAIISTLVIGRVGNFFRCYVHTLRDVLEPDPRDAIRRLLGLQLPTSASEVRYESESNPAGIVFWIRFDLPQRDWQTCLARIVALPGYAEFTPDAALKEYLETGYHTGVPPWWHPEELKEGLYAQRRNNTKDLSDVSVGFGPLSAETVRVYIGAFSPW